MTSAMAYAGTCASEARMRREPESRRKIMASVMADAIEALLTSRWSMETKALTCMLLAA